MGPLRLISAWWRPASVASAWAAIALGVVALLARSVSVAWQPMIVLAAFSPYVTGVSAIAAALVLGLRRIWLGVVASALLIALLAIAQAPLFVSSARSSHGPSLVLLQANVRVGGANAADLLDRVRSHHVDVLTVDELTAGELTRLTQAGVDQLLPYRLVATYPGGAGTGIWSRYPLSQQTRHDDFSFELLSTRVLVGGAGATELWAVHLLPPWPYPSRIWLGEITRLHSLIDQAAATSDSVVVSGDFNSGIGNREFRQLLGRTYFDAAEQSGAGWLPTYPTDRPFPPLLTLDHVLVRNASSSSAQTVSLPGSDHRGLLVRLRLPAA